MKKLDNKGFSYVEMIIVLALMTMLVGFLTISISSNKRHEVERTAEKMESLVNKARTSALTKGTERGVMNVAKVGGYIYYYVGEKIDDDQPEQVKAKGEKLCQAGTLEVVILSGSTNDLMVHRLHFKQSTGGLTGGDVEVKVRNNDGKESSFTVIGSTGKIDKR